MKVKLTFFCIGIVLQTVCAQIPHGLSEPVIWLKSERIDNFVTWENVLNNDPFQVSAERAGLLNYNPALTFNQKIFEITVPQRVQTLITVAAPEHATEQTVWSLAADEGSNQLLTSHRVADLATLRYMNFPVPAGLSPFLSTYLNNSGSSKINKICFGGHNHTGVPAENFQGAIPEVLIYDRTLAPVEKNKVESYLAIKYGLTLTAFDAPQYLSSKGDIIWDGLENIEFTHRIAGIGHDLGYGLNQKQSTSSQEPGSLVISVGALAQSNAENKSILEENTYLVWGDNDHPFALDFNSASISVPYTRQWKIQVSGVQDSLATVVQFDKKQIDNYIAPDEQFWLAVDRGGKGYFELSETDYYASKDGAGIVFDQVFWDADKSGADQFRLELGPSFFLNYDITQPICDSIDTGILTVRPVGGLPPYEIALWSGNEATPYAIGKPGEIIQIDQIPAGSYRLSAVDREGTAFETVIDLSAENGPEIRLEDQYFLSTDQPLHLSLPLGANVQWRDNYGMMTSGPDITIAQPGRYIVRAEHEKCVSIKSFEVREIVTTPFREALVYPNPVADGKYQLRVRLESVAEVQVNIIAADGRHISTRSLKGRDYYQLNETLRVSPGQYFVRLTSGNEQVSIPVTFQ